MLRRSLFSEKIVQVEDKDRFIHVILLILNVFQQGKDKPENRSVQHCLIPKYLKHVKHTTDNSTMYCIVLNKQIYLHHKHKQYGHRQR